MTTYRKLGSPFRCAAMLVIGVALSASASPAQDRGTCVTAWVPESFTLPDGTVRVAGKFTLCVHTMLNPVAGMHRLSTDAEGAILVKSKRTVAREYADRHPVLLFFRHAPGEPIDFVGYVVPFERKAWKYTLKNPAEISAIESASLTAPTPTGQIVTLLACNGD